MHMVRLFDLQTSCQRTCKWILLFCWFSGLLVGMLIAAGAGDSFSLMMRGGYEFTVSIPGQLLIIAFPFLFTAFAVFLSQRILLLAFVFLKAFAFGFSLFGILLVYGSASWLLQFLLMFSDICSIPLLMWVWFRCAEFPGKLPASDMLICLFASVVLGIFDICMVSPFAAMLL